MTTPATEMGIEPKSCDDILRDWESGAMDAAGTIEDLVTLLEATRTPEAAQVEIDEPYRTMDENGSPTDAGTVGWNWIGGLARQERERDAVLLVIDSTPVEGGGKVTRLYRGTSLLAVATTFRDEMNCTVLVRWISPEMRAALAQVRHPSGERK